MARARRRAQGPADCGAALYPRRGGKAPGDSGRVDVLPARVGCGARRDEPARELVAKAAENEDG